jgi:hypothetical protein
MKREDVPEEKLALYPAHFPKNSEVFYIKEVPMEDALAYTTNAASVGMLRVWDNMFGKTFAKAMHVSQRLQVRGLSSSTKSMVQKEWSDITIRPIAWKPEKQVYDKAGNIHTILLPNCENKWWPNFYQRWNHLRSTNEWLLDIWHDANCPVYSIPLMHEILHTYLGVFCKLGQLPISSDGLRLT